MPIPTYETLMLPLLAFAAENPGDEVRVLDAVNSLAGKFRLTEAEKTALLPSGGTFMFTSRVSWAATYLKKAALLEAPRRGCLKITKRGIDTLKQNPAKIDGEYLSQFEEFRRFKLRKKDKDGDPAPQAAGASTPIESIDSQFDELREALASEVLERVKACSPQFFERLVIKLLVKMGYGSSLKDAGQAIGRSGDGGIDGVIKEDKLGLDNIYVQAKRWTEKNVGSPDIDQFAGALQKKKGSSLFSVGKSQAGDRLGE